MAEASFLVVQAGPHVSVQDAGRPGLLRYGVPASGPMDRLAHRAANLALGKDAGAAGIEVSLGGLELECLAGEAMLAEIAPFVWRKHLDFAALADVRVITLGEPGALATGVSRATQTPVANAPGSPGHSNISR